MQFYTGTAQLGRPDLLRRCLKEERFPSRHRRSVLRIIQTVRDNGQMNQSVQDTKACWAAKFREEE